MVSEKLELVLSKMAVGTADQIEKQWLTQILSEMSVEQYAEVLQRYQSICKQSDHLEVVESQIYRKLEETIDLYEVNILEKKRIIPWWKQSREAVAVVVLLLLSSASAVYVFNNWNDQGEVVKIQENVVQLLDGDVAPGGEKAFIQIGNGSTHSLDNLNVDQLTELTGQSVNKLSGGELSFLPNGSIKNTGVEIHKISTPKGGAFKVVLSDGSKVWLNSASSITYPSQFEGGDRIVDITGEVYFEVASQYSKGDPQTKIPFFINVGNQRINVLGTQFNVKAYPTDPYIKTTLMEGSVEVTTQEQVQKIVPGQQTLLSTFGDLTVQNDVDLDEVLAWKYGNFYFSDTEIKDIMEEISRWYDVTVVYKGTAKPIFLGGQISRLKNLSEVLRLLELTGELWFQIEGDKVIVEYK